MGRPRRPIDWDVVEKKMIVGCTYREIVDEFDLTDQQFSTRFKEEFGDYYSVYSTKFHSIGKCRIRETQYDKALEGNTQMLMLLGEQWLKQGKLNQEDNKNELSKTDIENSLMLTKGILSKYKEKYGDIDDIVSDEPEAGSELPGVDTQI